MIDLVLFTLIAKNFKQLLRTKTSSLIILLGPLIIITLLGYAFNNSNEYALNIGVFSEQYSPTSEDFISALKENNYQITKMATEENCIDAIKHSTLHACIIFPKNLEIDPVVKPQIQFYIDSTKENLVYNVISTVSNKLSIKTQEYSKQLIDNMVTVINTVDADAKNAQSIATSANQLITEAKDASASAKSKLSAASLDYTMGNFEAVKNSSTDNNLKFSNLKSSANTTVRGISEAISDLKTLSDSISNSSQRTIINNIIADLNASANRTRTILNSNQSNYTDLSIGINNMIFDIENLNSKLSAAKSTNYEVSKSIDQMNAKLSEASVKLQSIQGSMDRIVNSIGSLAVKNPELLSMPFDIKIHSEKTNHFGNIFSGMIIIIIMFVSLLLSTQLIIGEKHSPAYFRNMISPISTFTYLFSMYLTNLIIVSLQVTIMLAMAIKFFKLSFAIWYVALVLFIATSIFSLLGTIIGYVFASEETATIAAISTSAILMFLSDLIIPIESIPRVILKYAKYNPVYRFKIIIELFNNNDPLAILISLKTEFYIYGGVIIGLFLASYIFAKLSRKSIFRIRPRKPKNAKR